MSGDFFLDWAAMLVSLFNTILLIWLGLTVLLNAERRTWGLWLAGGGLLTGAAFFISHSAILGIGLNEVGDGLEFWWRVGWLPVIALPLVWYVLILWYAGFWDERQSALRRRQRVGLMFAALSGLTLIVLLTFANPLPPLSQAARYALPDIPQIGGIVLIVITYPLFSVTCISFSLDALRKPGPSARVMGDLARRRARPWLTATTIVLLLVSLLVTAVMLWAITSRHALLDIRTLAWFDLLTDLLIAASITLIGQAIIAYEVFTGKTLPRRGFFRHWQRVLILAAGYSLVLAAALTLRIRPVYGLLLSTALVALFYALVSWRSYVERERTMDQLRPFVSSQRLYEQLLSSSAAPLAIDALTPFRALCAQVLGVRLAYLFAIGPLAPLVGAPLLYPANIEQPHFALNVLVPQFDSPQTMCVPLDPACYDGAQWAVPLWSERGLIGILFLGEKVDNGLYTQEEIEIARASGERLIDTQASSEIARRLMSLQRERLTESQLLDRRARRILHDEVLPQLHAAMLMLNAQRTDAQPPVADALERLADTHRQIANLLRDMPAAAPDVTRLGLTGALKQVITSELPDAFDAVSWQVEPQAAQAAQTLTALNVEVLFYAAREAIRNAARHARGAEGARSLHLCVKMNYRDGLQILIEDDGVGFTAGTTERVGGQGLSLHSTMMAISGGTLATESVPNQYTRVVLTLPCRYDGAASDWPR